MPQQTVDDIGYRKQAARALLSARPNPASGHLGRRAGACAFCPTLRIGPCDYPDELRPLTPEAIAAAGLAGEGRPAEALARGVRAAGPVARVWAATDEPHDPEPPPA